ncbi:uncharacterized protein ACNLHF_022861 [Anomaloglossus baeobatrachus]
MRILPVVLIAASVLLSAADPQDKNQPMCCQRSQCKGCACRSKNSLAVDEALKTYLEEPSDYRNKLETLEEDSDNDIRKRPTTTDSKKNTEEAVTTEQSPRNRPEIDSSNHVAGFDTLDCLMCKISHC